MSSKWGIIVALAFLGLFVFAFLLLNRTNLILDIILGLILITIFVYSVKVFLEILNPRKKFKHKNIRKRKISSEFKDIYNYVKTEYGKELEINRKKFLKSLILFSILVIIALIITIVLEYISEFKIPSEMIAIIFIPAYIYYYYSCQKYNKIYVENYKQKIIRNFVEHINGDLRYEQFEIPNVLNTYLEAEFEDYSFRSFVVDDYIYGYNEDGRKMEMSNVVLGKTNEKKEFSEVVYEGIFSTTQLNYNFVEEIRIKKNKYKLKHDQNKVLMDSSEFEKYFDVYCKSDILAMKLLTHSLMEEFVNFYEEFKIEFEVVIKNSKIYIRFNTGMMFEPNIIKKSHDISTLWVYYNILKFITNVTVELNKLIKDLDL